MREPGQDEARSAGPAVVWRGPRDAPVVLVLDPAGEARHDELPATWRPLAEHLRVGWCRLPAAAADLTTSDVLDRRTAHVHLVAGGSAAEPALRLAEQHPGMVRSVIAVDPVPTGSADLSTVDWWDSDTEPVRRRLTEHGVSVHAFVSREDDLAVRSEGPVPLGHPDVVGRVVQTLLSLHGADRLEEIEPELRDEVAAAWRDVREHVGPAMERARRTGGSGVE